MKRLLSLLFVSALFADRMAAASCPSGLFIQAASLPSGGPGRAIAIATIDSDAFPDLVVVQDQSLSVLLGHGDGTFDPPIVTSASGSGLYSVTVGDVNGDTKADLVVGSYGEVLVFTGHGDGTFDDPVFYFTNGGPLTGIVLGHFDANASLDIALAGGSLTGALVMLGNGDGTFAAAVFYSTGASGGYLTSGDLDEDGHVDLAVTSGDSIAVLLGAGDGTFGPASHYLAGASLEGIADADLDGDGHLDLVSTSDTLVSVLLGNGNGTFQAALQYNSSLSAVLVLVADLDLDGIPDVIVAGQSDFYGHSLGIAVLHGLGDGALAAGEAYSTGASSAGLAVADLNGDGFPDVVTADPADLAVSLLIDLPDGSLYAAPISSLPSPPVPDLFVQADFDEDGRQDFAWAQYSTVTTILGVPHGRFRPGVQLLDPFQQQIQGIGAGAFSGSLHSDLAIADFSSIWVFPGNGDGSFGAPVDVFDSSSLGTLEVGDFNGDGKADIAFVGGCCPGGMNVLLGNGDGTFLPPVLTPLTSDARLRLARDLTGDGRTDLVASSSVGALLFPGNGDGSFASPETLASGSDTFEAAAGDFDSNGFADLLLSDSSGSVRLFLADGGGILQPPLTIGVGGRTSVLAVADFDGDGKLDFAVDTGPVLVLLGLGNGHFQSPLPFPMNEDPVFIASGDYDGNGKPDLVSAGTLTLTTLLNAQLGATTPLDLGRGRLRRGAEGLGRRRLRRHRLPVAQERCSAVRRRADLGLRDGDAHDRPGRVHGRGQLRRRRHGLLHERHVQRGDTFGRVRRRAAHQSLPRRHHHDRHGRNRGRLHDDELLPGQRRLACRDGRLPAQGQVRRGPRPAASAGRPHLRRRPRRRLRGRVDRRARDPGRHGGVRERATTVPTLRSRAARWPSSS